MKHREKKELPPFSRALTAMRKNRGLSGVELCRRAGDLDPRTLTALEKGRIKNPSIKTLESLARGMGMTISALFREQELEQPAQFFLGSQKGAFHLDFGGKGAKIVSFTPLIHDFFCGKLILSPKARLHGTLLNITTPLFISMLIGRMEVSVEEKKSLLKEGDNLFFHGVFKHSFYNPSHKEAAFLLATAPSFLK
ncbi:MAG TPA: XRE family transcriptional regulator [Verrucomicrobiae bacterium]|nr:XRE family transcriptional regulator [Verrucomicrobiae bacterium]